MQAVNLLPKELIGADRTKLPLPLIGAGSVPLIALALVVTGYIGAHSQVGTIHSQLAAVNAQLAELAPTKLKEQAEAQAASAKTSVLVSERTARLTSLESALATGAPVDTFLAEIARVIPDNVWLTNLQFSPAAASAPAPAGSAPSTGFSIQGYTYSQPALAQLLARLQLVPTLTKVQLQSAAKATVGTKTLVQFTINAAPVAPAAPAPAAPAPASTTPAAPATTP